jgi:DNA polymerase phi
LEQNGDGYESDEDVEDEDDVEEDEVVESESGDDAADEEDDNMEVDAEFRRRVAEALQVAGMSGGENATNGDQDDDAMEDSADEEDDDEDDDESDKASISMDDDQMLALDEKLASIFKERRTGKKGNSAGESMDRG